MQDAYRYRVSPNIQLNQEQKDTLVSILDTFIPPLPQKQIDQFVEKYKELNTEEDIINFCKASYSSTKSTQRTMDLINRTFLPKRRVKFASLLSSLAASDFKTMPQKEREKEILRWKGSCLAQSRAIYCAFQSLACYSVYVDHPIAFSELMKMDQKTFTNLPERLPMMQDSQLTDVMKFDAIVIGSGAGGGVVSAELAKAGKSVLVIEKGRYYHETDFVPKELEGNSNLYEHGGMASSVTGSLKVMAGSVFGGGTTVNWCASLKLQSFVREEWAKQDLPYFLSPKFSRDLDTVYHRIGASTSGIKHNGPNRVIVEGCKALGYPFEEIPQNTSGKPHECNYCYCGCRSGIKNGTMNTWLRDAHHHGAQFLDKTKALKVLIEDGKAVGVECLVHYEKRVRIMADSVTVSAGSLQSPGILLSSGLKNDHIGKNLYLHPINLVYGYFDEKVNSAEGAPMTALSGISENTENDGYGSKIEGAAFHPGTFASLLPWQGASDHKECMLRYDYCAPLLILTRDKDSKGSVEYDEKDNVMVRYELSDRDRRSVSEGILRALDILVAVGARELHSGQLGIKPFKFESNQESRIDDRKYIDWKIRVKEYGLMCDNSTMLTAHQMGSNRMGSSPKTSVVKPTGETWEVKNLYIADASVFPTASGVNPMVTIEAIALHIASNIIDNTKLRV
ncbi:hypothetical protein G6F56_001399 [Rhizopus delemar]|nr:hypothetical protein G6F56_001399 [Rhizopus delemar]